MGEVPFLRKKGEQEGKTIRGRGKGGEEEWRRGRRTRAEGGEERAPDARLSAYVRGLDCDTPRGSLYSDRYH